MQFLAPLFFAALGFYYVRSLHQPETLVVMPMSLRELEMMSPLELPDGALDFRPTRVASGQTSDEIEKENASEKADRVAPEQATVKKLTMEIECAQPEVKPSGPAEGLNNKDLSNEVEVDGPPYGWVYPDNAKAAAKMKTVHIEPQNLRLWAEAEEPLLGQDILRNVLGSLLALQSERIPAEPLEPDTPQIEETRNPLPTNPEGERIELPSETQQPPMASNTSFLGGLKRMFQQPMIQQPMTQQPTQQPGQPQEEGGILKTIEDWIPHWGTTTTPTPGQPPLTGTVPPMPPMPMPMPMPMPGLPQPGMPQPGVQQPGLQQPGVQQPGLQQPGLQQPGIQQPGMQQPLGQPAPLPMPLGGETSTPAPSMFLSLEPLAAIKLGNRLQAIPAYRHHVATAMNLLQRT